MVQTKRTVEPLEAAIMQILNDEMQRRGMTLDDMAERSSMARSTIGKSLSGTRASTVSELESLCKALNVRVSSIVRQAEDFVKSAPSPADLDALDYISITEAKLARALQSDYTPAALELTEEMSEGESSI